MVPEPTISSGQAHPPALHIDLLDEVVYDERGFRELEAIYDYGDLRVLIGLNELTVDPVEPQGLVERQPPSAEAPLEEAPLNAATPEPASKSAVQPTSLSRSPTLSPSRRASPTPKRRSKEGLIKHCQHD
jgi:hypothetical protein